MYISTVTAMEGSFRDISLFGVELNRTARMASIAKAGQILASENFVHAASLNLDELVSDTAEFKGFDSPVTVFQI